MQITVIVCPYCQKKTRAYWVKEEEPKEGEKIGMLFPTRYCPHCGFPFTSHHAQCKTCGFTDWKLVVKTFCPICGGEME